MFEEIYEAAKDIGEKEPSSDKKLTLDDVQFDLPLEKRELQIIRDFVYEDAVKQIGRYFSYDNPLFKSLCSEYMIYGLRVSLGENEKYLNKVKDAVLKYAEEIIEGISKRHLD